MKKLNETHKLAAAGLICLLALATTVRVCVGLFNQEYVSSAKIILISDRAGLLTDINSPVKFRGVVVGRVATVRADGEKARLVLALEPSKIHRIPADVTARVQPVTVLGSKYVELVPADGPPGVSRPLAAGATIDTSSVTPEFNETFTDVLALLESISPAKLNAALYSLAAVLDGNSGRLRQIITDGGAVIEALDGRADELMADVRGATGVLNGYAGLAPDLVASLDQAGAFTATLAEQRQLFAALLGALTTMGYDMTDFLQQIQAQLGASTATLRPALELLARYSPALPCLLQGVAKNAARFRSIMGGPTAGGVHKNDNVTLTLARALDGYKFPQNLPKVAATGGPNCHGLPNVSTPPPFLVADVGANPYPSTSDATKVPTNLLSLWLFGTDLLASRSTQ